MNKTCGTCYLRIGEYCEIYGTVVVLDYCCPLYTQDAEILAQFENDNENV